ncbi:MAG: DUF1966 domain-containing protein [Myxococcaceae bacterium]|nr:DUF1966 domain-containing protein [Myxococcaceae bacterium]
MTSSTFRLPSALLAALALMTGCWSGDDVQPQITNHVDDWRDEVIYQLLTDRFADGDLGNNYNVDKHNLGRYNGGDYQGVIDKIPYLKGLGVTAVWISPIVKNVEEDSGYASYHGYWAQDFSALNPHFGDMAQLRQMINALHEAGIKVILDIVTNHIGQLFYYDINGNQVPDETVYFNANDTAERSQACSDNYSGSDWQLCMDQVTHVSEWDPYYEANSIQGRTSLGPSGPAPIEWLYMPEINRVPPMPAEFQNKAWYNRRGRIESWRKTGDHETDAYSNDVVEHADFPGGLKDLNTERQDVRDALFKVYARWIEELDLDGFRIDTVKHVDHGFWQDFCPRIRAHATSLGKERFLMFGEVFGSGIEKIASYSFNGELDTLFNFPQKYEIDAVFKNGAPPRALQVNHFGKHGDFEACGEACDWMAQKPNFRGFNGEAIARLSNSDGEAVNSRNIIVNCLDNHDVARFRFNESNPAEPYPVRDLQMALAYILLEEGIPAIYYGTEQNFSGGNDPRNREPLWNSGYSTETDTYRWVAQLTRIRQAYAPLRRGEMTFKWASQTGAGAEDSGILAFERTYRGETVLVVMNASDSQASSTSFGSDWMGTSFAPNTRLTDVMSGQTNAVDASGRIRLTLDAQTVMVLVPADKVVPL